MCFSWLFVLYEPYYAEIYKPAKAVAVTTSDSTSTGGTLTIADTHQRSTSTDRASRMLCCAGLVLGLGKFDLIPRALPWHALHAVPRILGDVLAAKESAVMCKHP